MSLYCILENKRSSLDLNIAKIGFSKLAFVFSFIWGFSNGIYLYAMLSFLFFIISLCLTFFGVLGFEAFVIMMLLNSFYWGIFGNVIFIDLLIKSKNYKPVQVLNSESKFTALVTRLSEINK
tara:strand:+ start:544 stop:909 length:366 start_codon:yes stop_codon:yes gene_type:complete